MIMRVHTDTDTHIHTRTQPCDVECCSCSDREAIFDDFHTGVVQVLTSVSVLCEVRCCHHTVCMMCGPL